MLKELISCTMVYKPYPRIHAAGDIGAPMFASESLMGAGPLRSIATKRLAPGTKRLLEPFGNALLCVRYRPTESGRRFITVELIVEERSGPPAREVWVRVGFGETELRYQPRAL